MYLRTSSDMGSPRLWLVCASVRVESARTPLCRADGNRPLVQPFIEQGKPETEKGWFFCQFSPQQREKLGKAQTKQRSLAAACGIVPRLSGCSTNVTKLARSAVPAPGRYGQGAGREADWLQ